jgi:3-oxoacyl-[acyl-carrier protein] reductase
MAPRTVRRTGEARSTGAPADLARIDLSGQAALVTGGSRGIGRAVVEALAGAGASVVFSYRTQAAAAREVERTVESGGVGQAVGIRCDVARTADADRLVSETLRRFGRLDILVNNAGIWTPHDGTPLETMSPVAWRRTLAVNLDGAFYVTRRAIPAMKRRRSGSILFVSSTAGQRGEENHGDYAASKGALISLTKSLAVELGPSGIRVNAVAPWWVETDMSREALERARRSGELQRGETSPLGRVAIPAEIAGPVLFLCSRLADYVTGEILNVNGGTILCG